MQRLARKDPGEAEVHESLGVLSQYRRPSPAALHRSQIGFSDAVMLKWLGEYAGRGDGVGDGEVDSHPADR